MPSYIAIIQKDSASDYGVAFPNFPGFVTAGATVDEAEKPGPPEKIFSSALCLLTTALQCLLPSVFVTSVLGVL
jgi:hypothetical protein